MQAKIQELTQQALSDLDKVKSTAQLYELRVLFLGKSGKLTELLKGLKDFSGQERANLGKIVNEAKLQIEQAFDSKNSALRLQEINLKLENDKKDISIDAELVPIGSRHPLRIINQRIIDFFVKLGFKVVDAPEIDTEFYNFEALNVLADHPARDMQDTFYLGQDLLLRSHTSNGQIRTMLGSKPPFKILSPGRVYRADELDASHSPMFHQIEGLVVDTNVTMCDLMGILELFAKAIFGQHTKVRLRQSYFPFTEPSVEVDASCICSGGCKICKGTGWIEILGAGLVNKAVIANCGLDSKKYSGFAFGLGLERITNIIFGINDMRLLYENDTKFLRQFSNVF
jgi:phenylalanyl-tRNA synthetase alpha chain